jgi:hypothetical protein
MAWLFVLLPFLPVAGSGGGVTNTIFRVNGRYR